MFPNFEPIVYQYFKDIATTLGADFQVMYSTPNGQELYETVQTRVSGGIPAIFCRVVDIVATNQDTANELYNCEIRTELILATNSIQEFDTDLIASTCEKFKGEFLLECKGRTLSVSDPRDAFPRFANFGRRLFRDANIDAVALQINFDTTIDFQDFTA